MDPERAQRCLEGGTSVLVGSVDATGAPAACRAVAIASKDNLATLTVYVPVATSRETISNVATTKRIAVGVTHIPDHTSVQFKGTAREVRLANDSEEKMLSERIEQFADALNVIGLPRRITRNMAHWPAFAIEVQIEETFEQTPGPNAGVALR